MQKPAKEALALTRLEKRIMRLSRSSSVPMLPIIPERNTDSTALSCLPSSMAMPFALSSSSLLLPCIARKQ